MGLEDGRCPARPIGSDVSQQETPAPGMRASASTHDHADDRFHDIASFRRLVAGRLAPEPSLAVFGPGTEAARGDHDLNAGAPPWMPAGTVPTIRPAAVLVPIIERPEGLSILLTRRPDHMPSHPGQIAFPGGKIEPQDGGPLAAALRETEEEIGLSRDLIDVLGFLDTYQTGTGFRIVPVVAIVPPGVAMRADLGEVAEIFEVPLGFLMDARNHELHSAVMRGARRYYYAMPYGRRYIWGATAGMLRNLHERLLD